MPNTYSQIYVQVVFAVKGRLNLIKESFREELQKYMAGIITEKRQKLLAIYCMPDHVHILISINPDISISELVRDIKSCTTLFIKRKGFCRLFAWQHGFGVFSYSKSHVFNVINYILKQPYHHKAKSFKEEYLNFLNKFEVEYHDKYLFEFYE